MADMSETTETIRELVLQAEQAKAQAEQLQTLLICLIEHLGQDKVTIPTATVKTAERIESLNYSQSPKGVVTIQVKRKVEQ